MSSEGELDLSQQVMRSYKRQKVMKPSVFLKTVTAKMAHDQSSLQLSEDFFMATTVKHPYIGQFEKIQSIPKSQRAAYQRKVNNIKVREGKPDISAFEQRFKNQGGFSYGSHLLHYHSIEQSASPAAVYVCVVAEEIRSDPHNFSCKVVPGSYLNLDRGIQKARKSFSKFTLPFITFMGGCEKVADLFGGVDFHEESPSADKTTICCPNMWHSALYEEQIEIIAQISASWVKQRL